MAAGELIYQLEERPHVLVSRSRVERTWNARYREFFRHYAYPLTDELYVLWDDDPEAWKPINHSCDPNAWVTGLDLSARRPIRAGEEITMDYATMYTERRSASTCHCGTALLPGRLVRETTISRTGSCALRRARDRLCAPEATQPCWRRVRLRSWDRWASEAHHPAPTKHVVAGLAISSPLRILLVTLSN